MNSQEPEWRNEEQIGLCHSQKDKWSGWTLGILKLTITKRWLQNEKDHSKFRKSWDHSRTSWNYQTLGEFITSSMQLSLCRIWKRTYTDPISSDLLRISRMTKNDTKW